MGAVSPVSLPIYSEMSRESRQAENIEKLVKFSPTLAVTIKTVKDFFLTILMLFVIRLAVIQLLFDCSKIWILC